MFGEDSIERFSTFANIQFDEQHPNWIPFTISRNMLVDDTSHMSYNPDGLEKTYS